MADTVFSKIIRKEIPAKIIHDDEHCLAFHDVAPQAPVHVLVIPKKEIPSLESVQPTDKALIGHLFFVANELAKQLKLSEGYRVVINCGRDGGQSVDHLHVHLLGGRAMGWPPG